MGRGARRYGDLAEVHHDTVYIRAFCIGCSTAAALLLAAALASYGYHPAQAAGSFTVNSSLDNNTKDSVLTLREAILVANGTLTNSLSAGEKAQLGGCTFTGSRELRRISDLSQCARAGLLHRADVRGHSFCADRLRVCTQLAVPITTRDRALTPNGCCANPIQNRRPVAVGSGRAKGACK